MFLKKYFFLILFVLISFIAILDLFHPGFPITHDGDVHLLRLTNFYQSLQEGNIIPRWAANVNFGYGQPVFEFFYPFPLYLASLFHSVGFSFADSLKIILILSMVLSGISMYIWLTELFFWQAGFIGGLLYVFAPFRFVDTYVRGDTGENFAFVFIPLICYAITKIAKNPKFTWTITGGIFLALLILTHNVVSLMSLPFILFYGLYCWFYHNKKKLYAGYFFWLIIAGFSLSAFFWMPGLLEGKYTLRNIVTAGEYKSRFVDFSSIVYGPWSYGGTGKLTVQLGILQWIVLIISILLFSFQAKIHRPAGHPIHVKGAGRISPLGIILYTLAGIFFMLPASDFVWSKIILLQNFQFPWRFLVVTTFGTAVLGGYVISVIKIGVQNIEPLRIGKNIYIIFIIFLILFLNKDYMHAKGFVYRPDNYFSGIQRAPADTGESSPLWGVRFMEHGFKNPLEIIIGKATITEKERNSTKHNYSVIVKERTRFLENTLYFPGWKVFANGKEIPVEFQDQQYRGFITFYLEPGQYDIDVKFENTKLRMAADGISLISILIIISYVCFSIFLKHINEKVEYNKDI